LQERFHQWRSLFETSSKYQILCKRSTPQVGLLSSAHDIIHRMVIHHNLARPFEKASYESEGMAVP
jgi:hypothetical protein